MIILPEVRRLSIFCFGIRNISINRYQAEVSLAWSRVALTERLSLMRKSLTKEALMPGCPA